jgi:hypothetical protein
MGNLMISHILFNLFSKYNIGSFGFRKVLAILITILIFGLLYITVRFTGIEIPNYTRNLVMLMTVDLAGFLFIMWKTPKEPPKEDVNEVEPDIVEEKKKENMAEKKGAEIEIAPLNIETKTNKIAEEERESEVIIKKIEEVNEVNEVTEVNTS